MVNKAQRVKCKSATTSAASFGGMTLGYQSTESPKEAKPCSVISAESSELEGTSASVPCHTYVQCYIH